MVERGSRSRPHVLIIVENLPVPFDARVWQESLALKENGFDVSVICPKGKKEFRENVQVLNGILILRHDLPLEARGAVGYLMEYIAALYWQWVLAVRLYRHRPFDVIQACNPPDLSFIVAKRFKRRRGVKFVFDHHDLSPELYFAKFGRRDLIYRLLLKLEKLTFRACDYSIATNESYRDIAINRGGMDPDNVAVVRSGPALSRMYPVPPNDAWKQGKNFLVAFVGVMARQDGLSYILGAARSLRFHHHFEDVHFVLVGDGPDFFRLQSLSVEMGVADMVEFAGRLPDTQLREVLSTSDVCVNPDEYNEFNDKSTMNKVMEYMAVGKPIVQFDLREGRVSAGESSLYCKPNDADDLAEKLVWILGHEKEREEMGLIGRDRVRTRLAWNYEKTRYIAYYKTISGSITDCLHCE